MSSKKIKTYVITLSQHFPKGHVAEGLPTNFNELVTQGKKIHTIRGNYKLWKKRFDKIEKGEAILSIRYWSGSPYKSNQITFLELKNTDGIGIQKLNFYKEYLDTGWIVGQSEFSDILLSQLAYNDGLDKINFVSWFKKYDFSEPMAIIHFTPFRYFK